MGRIRTWTALGTALGAALAASLAGTAGPAEAAVASATIVDLTASLRLGRRGRQRHDRGRRRLPRSGRETGGLNSGVEWDSDDDGDQTVPADGTYHRHRQRRRRQRRDQRCRPRSPSCPARGVDGDGGDERPDRLGRATRRLQRRRTATTAWSAEEATTS